MNAHLSRLFRILTIAIFISTLAAACKKDDKAPTSLPPITNEGKNTFGCKVNGQVWVPYYPCFYGKSQMSLEIHPAGAGSILPLSFGVDFATFYGQGVGDSYFYFLPGQYSTDKGIYGTYNYYDSLNIQYIGLNGTYSNQSPFNPIGPYYFQINTLDTIKGIIAGTFAFTLYGTPTDSLVVTEGRFDLKFGTLDTCTSD